MATRQRNLISSVTASDEREREKINCEFPFKAPSHFAQTERLITHSTNSANKTRKKEKKNSSSKDDDAAAVKQVHVNHITQCIQQISVFQDFHQKRVRKKKKTR